MPQIDLLAELRWRGLVYQNTEGLLEHLEKATSPIVAYCGFDPTAASLHVGNLVQIMGLVHLQRAGHRPVALVGGGTGMIGDPSGKSSERNLQTLEQVNANVAGIREQLGRYLKFEGDGDEDLGTATFTDPNTATNKHSATGPIVNKSEVSNTAILQNNGDWLLDLHAVEFMRDVGKHFTINYMMAKDSVKSRIETGISYTEFSYMLLQAYDFLQLNRKHGVTLQTGGSDQWGNITAGIELIRRADGKEAHGLTLPLVTTATGAKFGKSEAGAIWLDAKLTSPYKFYQFWKNTDDRDVGKYLRYFTLMSQEEILALEAAMAAAPEKREAQTALARDVTTRTHGAEATEIVEEATKVLFAKGDPKLLSPGVFAALVNELPSFQLEAAKDETVLDLFVSTGLVKSKGEARRLADQGGTYVNGERAAGATPVAELERLGGSYLLLRKGARDYAVVTVGNIK